MPERCRERQEALGNPGANPGHGASAVALEVELGFEGVVDRLDDLAQGFEEPCPGTGRFAGLCRAQQGDPGAGEFGLQGLAVKFLSPINTCPVRSGPASPAVPARISSSTVRSSALAPVSAKPTGTPCTVVTRCRRSPQQQREWEAQ